MYFMERSCKKKHLLIPRIIDAIVQLIHVGNIEEVKSKINSNSSSILQMIMRDKSKRFCIFISYNQRYNILYI